MAKEPLHPLPTILVEIPALYERTAGGFGPSEIEVLVSVKLHGQTYYVKETIKGKMDYTYQYGLEPYRMIFNLNEMEPKRDAE